MVDLCYSLRMSESYCYWFLSVCHSCAIAVVLLVLAALHDGFGAVVIGIVIALMAFDVGEVDLKSKHLIKYLNSMSSIPSLALNFVCVINRYFVTPFLYFRQSI